MMAHGSSTSRHGRYDACCSELSSKHADDDLTSQSVFSYDETEDVKQPREDSMIQSRLSARRHAVGTHEIISNGPVMAVRMLDNSQTPKRIHALADSGDGVPLRSNPPHPPATPQSQQRPGSLRRRMYSGPGIDSSQDQRPPSARGQRPGSARRLSADSLPNRESTFVETLPPVSVLRPQSSLRKYPVLPSISPVSEQSNLVETFEKKVLAPKTGHKPERQELPKAEEMDDLSSRLANQSLAENWHGTIKSDIADVNSAHEQSRYELGKNSWSGSKHKVLPPKDRMVGKMQDIQKLHHDTPLPVVSLRSTVTSEKKSSLPLERSYTSLTNYKMDEDLQTPSSDQILLGIKIPTDGTRHKQFFNRQDQLRRIILFAEEVSGKDFSNYILVLATARKLFHNLSLTIEDAGIENKSVVHLEELD